MLRLLSSSGDRAPGESIVRDLADPLRALASDSMRGDAQALRTLLIALGPTLMRVVRAVLGVNHADVDDVLQEAMVAVHDALPSFRGDCKTVHFACRIAVNVAMNARRRAGYRMRHTPLVSSEELAACAADGPSPAEALAAGRRREALRELLGALPPAQCEVLALHILLGYSVEETAASIGAPVNTVRSRLRAALAALRSRVSVDNSWLEVIEVGQ
ncbi:MAG TPA: RNA polymerase sigma factor [Polyangiaceae bacterium]|jgi:RNA polymerase sigma-70 factor (ECF subfamily)|nr:RNA polymerase sigma factor [Polyangiaceae bacterium]